jgi:hypothetical protein
VPAEWHGWLHHITDTTGDKVSFCLHISSSLSFTLFKLVRPTYVTYKSKQCLL